MRVLLTGATGVVGSEIRKVACGRAELTCVARRSADRVLSWNLGREPAPDELAGHWDVIVHTAASTRWTMNRQEAAEANLGPLRAVLRLADDGTHVVQVSTAYVGTADRRAAEADPEFDGYRNGYEWSKAECERELLSTHRGPVTVVRPPLILGRASDGGIERFSGPYTLLQSLVSGLAAAVVGEPTGYAEIAPVDLVAETVLDAALAEPPTEPYRITVAAGPKCLRLAPVIELICAEINRCREHMGLGPIAVPPLVPLESWRRFYLPFATEHLSPMQNEAVRLLSLFEGYTSMAKPFAADRAVTDPEEVVVRSIRYWAKTKPRLVSRAPRPWSVVG